MTDLNHILFPIRAIMNDAKLAKALVERNLEHAFGDIMDAFAEGDAGEAFIAEFKNDVVNIVTTSASSIDAFMTYRSLGWHGFSEDLRAFEDMYKFIEADRKQILKERSDNLGYKGPFPRPFAATVDRGTRIVLGIQPDELAGELQFLAVDIDEDGDPDRNEKGALDMMRMSWLDVDSILYEWNDKETVMEALAQFHRQETMAEARRRRFESLHDDDAPDRTSVFEDLLDILGDDDGDPKEEVVSIGKRKALVQCAEVSAKATDLARNPAAVDLLRGHPELQYEIDRAIAALAATLARSKVAA